MTKALSGSPPSVELKRAGDTFLLLFERIIQELLREDDRLRTASPEVFAAILENYGMMSSVLFELLTIQTIGDRQDSKKCSDSNDTVPPWCEVLADCASQKVRVRF